MAPFGLALFGDSGDASLPDRIEPCARGNDAAFEKFIDGALVRIYNESSARTADGKALRASCKPLLGAPHSHIRGAIPEAWSKPRPAANDEKGFDSILCLEIIGYCLRNPQTCACVLRGMPQVCRNRHLCRPPPCGCLSSQSKLSHVQPVALLDGGPAEAAPLCASDDLMSCLLACRFPASVHAVMALSIRQVMVCAPLVGLAITFSSVIV